MEEKIVNGLLWTVYGDALGFLNENIDIETKKLKSFTYFYDEDLAIEKSKGQYSYITELILITIKSLIDSSERFEVTMDYHRFFQELKLWRHYRHGNPRNLLEKLRNRDFYRSKFYWQDVRGHGISRILAIALANKNYHAAEKETYKNLIYLNRHPRILLSGLLLLRVVYLVLEKELFKKEELIQELKQYLIYLQLNQLNHDISGDLPKNYKIQFEKEKIDYLMIIDMLKEEKEITISNWDCKAVLLHSLNIFFKLQEREEITFRELPKEDIKEVLAIGYGLWGISNKENFAIKNILKEEKFLSDMGKYLFRLRNFQINRTSYEKIEDTMDLFNFEKGDIKRHIILGVTKIQDKIETSRHTRLLLETKSGVYTFVKAKARQ